MGKEEFFVPIDKMNEGIIVSLWSANSILHVAKEMFDSSKKIGFDGKYAVVFYYYALEELGKAKKLESEKENHQNSNEKEINIGQWYKEHNKKIDEAIKHYGKHLHLDKLKWIPTSTHNGFTAVSDGPLFESFIDRSNMWLTSYDRDSKTWQENIFRKFEPDQLIIRIEELEKIITELLKKYNTRAR